jgi:diguanylate cyclase (GGDEF)-like protein/PAS domain S-box-containing protein
MDTYLFSAFLSTTAPHLFLVAALLVLWWKDQGQRFFLLLGLAELSATMALWCAAPWVRGGQVPPMEAQLAGTLFSTVAGYFFYRAAMDFGEVEPRRQMHWAVWLIPAGISVGLIVTGHFDPSIRLNAAMGAFGCMFLGHQLMRGSRLDQLVSIFVWLRVLLWLLYTVQGPFAKAPAMPFPIAVGFGFSILVAGVLKSWRKAGEIHAREMKLLEEHRRSFEQSTLARIKVDKHFRVTGWNPAAEALFGYSDEQARGLTVFDLTVEAEGRAEARAEWETVLSQRSAKTAIQMNVTKSGAPMCCEWHHDVLIDEVSGQLSMSSIVRDVTEQRKAEADVRFLAYHDRLTELPNRLQFEEVLQQMWLGKGARPESCEVGIFFIDVDSFKLVNDMYGHRAGDLFLLEIVERFRRALPTAQCLARFEGDEFSALVALKGGRAEADEFAQAIHRSMEDPVLFDGHQHTAMVSVGISFLKGMETPWRVTLQEADIALTAAKHLGPQRTKVFQEEMHTDLLEKVKQENALRHAIDRNEFSLVYQPQFDLKARRVVGVEVLLRWQMEGKAIPPDKFFSVAEQSDLIVEIGDWVLQETIQQASRWNGTELAGMRMGVNVASRQLQRPDFVAKLDGWLADAGVSPETIQLEITERALLAPLTQTLQTFEALKRSGISIALDDFGIGYSALAYLIRYPIDKIKIDRLFVQEIGRGSNQAKLTEAIVGIAQVMQVPVIAEGVETVTQARYLLERGCCEIQGFLISPPLRVAEVERLIVGMAGGYDWESAPLPLEKS